MECEGFESRVLDLLYGELPEGQRKEAEGHAASCGSCGKLARELGEARKLAASLPHRIEPPRELDERIAIAARAAAESRDVRRQPLRGGALHVAAAVILLGTLAATSFALGARFGTRPIKRYYPGDPGDELPEQPIRVYPAKHSPPPTGPEINQNPGGGEEPSGPRERDQFDRQNKFNEELLKLANEELDERRPQRALTLFESLVANARSPRLLATLEARLGRARALHDLGRLTDAKSEAEGVKEALERDHAPAENPEAERLLDRTIELLALIGREK
jgi:hypothetical protein